MASQENDSHVLYWNLVIRALILDVQTATFRFLIVSQFFLLEPLLLP